MTPGIEIRQLNQINNTPVVPLAVAAWSELLAAGFCDATIMVQWDHKAIYAVVIETEEVVGILTYADQEWRKSFEIALGWVCPEYRRQGIYRRLWEALVEIARKEGRREIVGATHRDNTRMQAVYRRLGRPITAVVAVYPVSTERSEDDEQRRIQGKP